MFSDVTVSAGVPSGLDRDSTLSSVMRRLAKRRLQNTSTDDTAAAFKESDHERKFSTENRVVGM